MEAVEGGRAQESLKRAKVRPEGKAASHSDHRQSLFCGEIRSEHSTEKGPGPPHLLVEEKPIRSPPQPQLHGLPPTPPASNRILGMQSPLVPLFGQVPSPRSFSHSLVGKKKKKKERKKEKEESMNHSRYSCFRGCFGKCKTGEGSRLRLWRPDPGLDPGHRQGKRQPPGRCACGMQGWKGLGPPGLRQGLGRLTQEADWAGSSCQGNSFGHNP